MQLILVANCALRAVPRVLQITFSFIGQDWYIPSWSTVRLWLLRIGLAQLRIPLEPADDWIWIVDCSVQIGNQKVLVILGVRASSITWGQSLSHKEVNLVALEVLNQAKKEDIHRCLEESCRSAMVPTAIVSDHGADLLAGIKLLQESHSEIRNLYDAKHKAACLLKANLEKDRLWTQFQTQLGQCKFKTQQTVFAYASAPSQRSKAKYMNLQKVVRWAKRILWHLDKQSKARPISLAQSERDQKFRELFGWVEEYRPSIDRWSQWLEAIESTLDLVRREGLSKASKGRLEERLAQYNKEDPIISSLIEFINSQSKLIRQHEKLPLSTEVLESLFSKLKNAERTQEKSGFTSMVLSLGAMLGPKTIQSISESLRSTPTRAVYEWAKEKLGKTVQAARMAFYRQSNPRNKTGQNETAIA